MRALRTVNDSGGHYEHYTVYSEDWFVRLKSYIMKKYKLQQLLDTENQKSQTICLFPNGFNPVAGHACVTRHLSLTVSFTKGHVDRLNRDRCWFFNLWCLSSTILGRLNAVTPLTIMTARPRGHSLCSTERVYRSLL